MLRNIAALCVLGFVVLGVANATPISHGSTVAASPLSYSGIQVGYYNQNNIDNGVFVANYAVSVYSDPANGYCVGCLDFVFSVANIGKGGAINDLTAGFFNLPYKTNVGYWGTQGNAPTSITLTNGGLIDFNFAGNSITSGQFSQFLVVQTDATNFDAGVVRTGIGMDGSTIPGFEPAVTPEPGTLVLLGTGLVGLAGVARMKFMA